MANRGPHTNSSQFFITLAECSHLNGKHVVFGKVVKGMEVIRMIEETKVDTKDNPLKKVEIVNCGELEFRGPAGTSAPASVSAEKRSRSESRSESSHSSKSDSEDEEERRERKKRRKEEKREAKRIKKEEKKKKKRADSPNTTPRQVDFDPSNPYGMETEEEYDARLEREENERREARRREDEQRRKEEMKAGKLDERTGIRYKGTSLVHYIPPSKTKSWRRSRQNEVYRSRKVFIKVAKNPKAPLPCHLQSKALLSKGANLVFLYRGFIRTQSFN